MKFNSQICTTEEQSERLLALGLKKETADMAHQCIGVSPYKVWDKSEISDNLFPAWSLHRLIEIADQRAVSPFSSIGNLYDDIIAHIQSLIHLGYINAEYLDMDIVNKREGKNLELLKNGEE